MKAIPLLTLPALKTIDLIRTVASAPPQGGMTLETVRARCRVLDPLDMLPENATELLLEDGDYQTLVMALKAFQFGVATKDILTVSDGILGATTPATAAA